MEEGIGSPGVTDGCETPREFWVLWRSSQELFTPKLSLWLSCLVFDLCQPLPGTDEASCLTTEEAPRRCRSPPFCRADCPTRSSTGSLVPAHHRPDVVVGQAGLPIFLKNRVPRFPRLLWGPSGYQLSLSPNCWPGSSLCHSAPSTGGRSFLDAVIQNGISSPGPCFMPRNTHLTGRWQATFSS